MGGILSRISSKTLDSSENDAARRLADRLKEYEPANSFRELAKTLKDIGVAEEWIKKILSLISVNESDDPNNRADSFTKLAETLDEGGLSSKHIFDVLVFIPEIDNPCQRADRLRGFDPGASFEREDRPYTASSLTLLGSLSHCLVFLPSSELCLCCP